MHSRATDLASSNRCASYKDFVIELDIAGFFFISPALPNVSIKILDTLVIAVFIQISIYSSYNAL